MKIASRVEKDFLPFVNKPGRYTGNEFNTYLKNPEEVQIRVALAFPEVYELGMSYVGFDILYHILNREKHIWAERVYAPWLDAEDVLRNQGIPLFSLESRTALSEFDWIGFTLQYELTYTNVLNMLDLAGIPLRSVDRGDAWPLIIGGGPSASNPEPVADFFDAILIGDGEQAVLEICRVVQEAKTEQLDRAEALYRLSQIQGIYVPSFYRTERDSFGDFRSLVPQTKTAAKRIVRRILPRLEAENYPDKPLVPLIEITHNRLAVEIMRGCTEGCRFCNAGMIYRPVRQRPADDILAQTKSSISSSGFSEVSLLSLNSSDYQGLDWLMVKEKMLLAEDKVKFALPSLRLDAVTPELIEFVKTVKKTGFTFAPEAGSQRLRNVINKNIRKTDLLNALRLILDNGWQLVKFYFMIGLPTEKEEDILAIADLVNECRHLAAGYKNVRFNISISPFSPKPHTPFQWEKQDFPEEIDQKINLLRNRLQGPDVHITWRSGQSASLETVLIRGGRELSAAIEEAWKRGARFDGWAEGFEWKRWEESFETCGIQWKKYLRPMSVSAPLPWDHLDFGISKSFLQEEKVRAYQNQVSRDCQDFVCLGCGLQRRDFENLVSCYRKTERGQTKKQTGYSLPAQKSTPEPQAITYGRGAKKRRIPAAPVKKKIRVRYTKTGLTRFLSHLDVMRIFDRACRRAKISLVYSQGFTPRPRLAFGPPLSLGIASTAEYLDMEAEIGREADIQEKLNAVLPAGLRIISQRTIYSKVPSIASSVNRVCYETSLADADLSAEQVEDWLMRDEVLVERVVKEQKKTLDIRPFVERMELGERLLLIDIQRIGDQMAKVTEVLESLLAPQGMDYRRLLTQRTGQFHVEDGKVLDPLQIV